MSRICDDGRRGEIKPRLPQPAVVFQEEYGVDDERELRAQYDKEMSKFSARHEIARTLGLRYWLEWEN